MGSTIDGILYINFFIAKHKKYNVPMCYILHFSGWFSKNNVQFLGGYTIIISKQMLYLHCSQFDSQVELIFRLQNNHASLA